MQRIWSNLPIYSYICKIVVISYSNDISNCLEYRGWITLIGKFRAHIASSVAHSHTHPLCDPILTSFSVNLSFYFPVEKTNTGNAESQRIAKRVTKGTTETDSRL